MSLRIASFNVHNLSLESGKDLERIARIIRDNDIDIIAMQEVLAEGHALNGISAGKGQQPLAESSCLKYYLPEWGMAWCDPRSRAKDYSYLGDDKRGEGYAFLWNTRKVYLPKDDRGIIYPRILDNYHVDSSSGQIRLIRNPCYGRFRLKSCNAEIRLITTHIVFGKPKDGVVQISGEQTMLDAGAIAMRQNEFNILAGKIYQKVNDYRMQTDSTGVTTILLGDYNLNLRKVGEQRSALVQHVALFDKKGNPTTFDPYSTVYTLQDELTTLKKDGPGYANNYDHFSLDEKAMRTVSSVRTIDAVCPNGTPSEADFEDYKKTVSDHIPILIEIDLRKRGA